MGGDFTVNETNSDILAYAGVEHPQNEADVYRSQDHGKTWTAVETQIQPDGEGSYPHMHLAEHGITLHHGEQQGPPTVAEPRVQGSELQQRHLQRRRRQDPAS